MPRAFGDVITNQPGKRLRQIFDAGLSCGKKRQQTSTRRSIYSKCDDGLSDPAENTLRHALQKGDLERTFEMWRAKAKSDTVQDAAERTGMNDLQFRNDVTTFQQKSIQRIIECFLEQARTGRDYVAYPLNLEAALTAARLSTRWWELEAARATKSYEDSKDCIWRNGHGRLVLPEDKPALPAFIAAATLLIGIKICSVSGIQNSYEFQQTFEFCAEQNAQMTLITESELNQWEHRVLKTLAYERLLVPSAATFLFALCARHGDHCSRCHAAPERNLAAALCAISCLRTSSSTALSEQYPPIIIAAGTLLVARLIFSYSCQVDADIEAVWDDSIARLTLTSSSHESDANRRSLVKISLCIVTELVRSTHALHFLEWLPVASVNATALRRIIYSFSVGGNDSRTSRNSSLGLTTGSSGVITHGEDDHDLGAEASTEVIVRV